MRKIKYYWACVKWLYAHKDEPNNRAKYRRMMREIALPKGEEE